jgi:hypothetical protein
MTRNEYCDVCGTEQVKKRWVRKQKPESSLKKKPLSSKKKKIIVLSVVLVLGVVFSSISIWFAQQMQYEGHLKIYSVNVVPIDQTTEELEIQLGLEQSMVYIKEIELFSVARDNYYESYTISFELEEYETRFVSFALYKFDPLFNEGFSLKITHKYKVQLITYTF